MLAVNGFDCRDADLLKRFQDPWIHIAVYKSNIKPLDPGVTSWLDLVDTGLLHPSVINSINRHGHLRQEEIIMPWLDKENYYIDYVSTWTEIPKEAGEPKIEGIFNQTIEVQGNTLFQANKKTKEPKQLKAVGITRPPKERFVK